MARHALLAGLVLAFPAPAFAATVEQTGTVRVMHADLEAGGSRIWHELVTPSGRVIELVPGRFRPALRSGRKARLRGTWRGRRFVLRAAPRPLSFADSIDGTWSSTVRPLKGAGIHRTLVIQAVIPGQPAPSQSTAELRSVTFGATGSVDHYYREQSAGTVGLTGDVVGPYTLAGATVDPTGCTYTSDWMQRGIDTARAAGVLVDTYDIIVLALSRAPNCDWGGLGGIGWGRSWINGYYGIDVVSHELGHNLGAFHASTLTCSGGTVPLSASCLFDEYGDPFDVMGAVTRQMNAPDKLDTGIWDASAVRTVTAAGTYTIANASGTTGVRALRIPRVAGSFASSFFVELRRPSGLFDSFAPTMPGIDGVQLRLDGLDRNGNGLFDGTDSFNTMLINAHAGSSGSIALGPGETFTDPGTTIRIRLVAYDDSAATVAVSFDGTPTIDTTPPTAPGQPTASISASGDVTLDWPAATDAFGVSSYKIFRDGAVLGTSSTPTFEDVTAGLASSYVYHVVAADAAGNTSAPSPTIRVDIPDGTVVLPPPDSSRPTIVSLRARVVRALGRRLLIRGTARISGPRVDGCTLRIRGVATRSCKIRADGSVTFQIRVRRLPARPLLSLQIRWPDGTAERTLRLRRR